jgi:hypothetical protein
VKKRKKKSKRQTKKQNLKSCCLFYCEKKVQRRVKEKQKNLFKKESALENKHSLSTWKRTHQTQQSSSFPPKRQKKITDISP